jgi:hypothetical protein
MTSLYALFHKRNYNDNTIEGYVDGQDHVLIRMDWMKGIVTNIFKATQMDSANDAQT